MPEARAVAVVVVSAATYWVDKPYSYSIPAGMKESVLPGVRVMVPFGRGNRRSEGIVLSLGEADSGKELKPIAVVLDSEPVLSAEQLKLAVWMRDRYFCTVFEAARSMLPAGLWYAVEAGYALAEGVAKELAYELAGDSEWDVISTGGNLLGDYLALVGTKAIENISSYHVDKAIISCKGINMLSGITDANELFSHVKRTMLKSADQRILAVDYTKFEITAFSQICDMAEIDIVVTDMKPSGRWLTYFEEKGIKCLYGEMYESNSIRE
jgi:primosomal protein N'